MSTTKDAPKRRRTVRDIKARKGQEPIVCLTAYTAPQATLLDPYVDLLLVGDSLGMVLYGMDTTLNVSVDMMINHGAAVVRGSEQAIVVIDMPFGSYEGSPQSAFENASRILKETGAAAVKLEGGEAMAETIAFLTARGIPVMGHIGLMPQSVHADGGYRTQGKDDESARKIRADSGAVEQAGAFSMVIEGTVEPLAREITQNISIPTIGIGASPACDGQVLVTEDLLGLFGAFTPKFVRRYAELGDAVSEAVAAYAADVKARSFPAPEHCFGSKPSRVA